MKVTGVTGMGGGETVSSMRCIRWVAELGERVLVDVGVAIAGMLRWS